MIHLNLGKVKHLRFDIRFLAKWIPEVLVIVILKFYCKGMPKVPKIKCLKSHKCFAGLNWILCVNYLSTSKLAYFKAPNNTPYSV